MKNESKPCVGRGTNRRTIGAALVIFLVTFLSTLFFVNPSGVYGPKISTAEGSGASEGDCYVSVDAPKPYLRCGSPVQQFEKLRQSVIDGAGFDFLARCGDLMRNKKSKSSKPGVAQNSKHKSGQAFDYNQEDPRVLIVREDKAGLTYWRTYLRCEKQDGRCGVKAELNTDNAGHVSAYVFDFTAAAEGLGWERIPAQQGWEYRPIKKEFWHYQLKENETFDKAESASGAEPSRMAAPLRVLIGIMSRLSG